METKTFKIIVALACFLLGAYISYDCLLRNIPVYLSSRDLVEASTKQTRFLRLKQWKKAYINNSNTEAYGDKLGKSGKSFSGVAVTQDPKRVVLPAAPDLAYELVRKTARESKELREGAKKFFANEGLEGCQATVDIKDDTTEQNGLVGIVIITSSCGSQPEHTRMVTRLAVGREDGCFRYISVFSYNEYWRKNGKVFEEILNSVSYLNARYA